MQENFTMIKMLSLRKTKSLNTPCSPCVHLGKKIRFNDSDRFSIRILFGLNQLPPIVHFYYLFLSTDTK